MIRLLKIEGLKHRRRFLLLPPALLLILQFAIGYMGSWDAADLEQGWYAVFYQFPLLNAILLPTALAILASRFMDLEHKGSQWKQLYTLHSPGRLFLCKLIYGALLILALLALQAAGMLAFSRILGFTQPFEMRRFLQYLLPTALVCFVVFFMELLLAFLFDNQAVAFSVGLTGSLAGLFLMYLPSSLLHLVLPWGLFGETMFIRLDWDAATRISTFYAVDQNVFGYISAAVWIAALASLTILIMTRTDIDGMGLKAKATARRSRSTPVRLSRKHPELLKIKGSPIWLPFIILPLISAVIGTVNYRMNLGILKSGWTDLWSQHTLFLAYFFLPGLFAVFCSFIWREEHRGYNWNQLLVHKSPAAIILGKSLVAWLTGLLCLLYIAVLYVAGGKTVGITGPLPAGLPEWLACGALGMMAVCSLHLFLSLVIRSFALPVVLGIAGGFLGLACTAKGLLYAIPYTLMNVGFRANNPEMEIDAGRFIVRCLAYILAFSLAGVLYLRRADVKTES